MYIDKILPFVKESDFVKNLIETKNVRDIYIPFNRDFIESSEMTKSGRILNAFHIFPLDIIVMNETDKVSMDVLRGVYGNPVRLNLTYLDYSNIANRLDVNTDEDGNTSASLRVLNGFDVRNNLATDIFINLSSNGVSYTDNGIVLEPDTGISYKDIMDINEESPFLGSLFQSEKSGTPLSAKEDKNKKKEDVVYKILDGYFSAPESMTNSRETVPLLIGPTAVFKSATVKELCKKHDFRLVDFRVSFTSRLDYTGLINMARVDDELFNYSCPMEEIVTCSDGFREFCRRAYDKIDEILSRGYIEDNKVSDGESVESVQKSLSEEQSNKLKSIRKQYEEYIKTPVLFFDEITRCKDQGVNNVLVELLNKKKLDNMTLYGCKFVAATNANVMNDSKHLDMKFELDDLYDVNDEIDVAYANRFQPIVVLPEDVKDRWFDWANSQTEKFGKTVTSIHPTILDFLKRNPKYTYNDKPVLDSIDQGLSQNEQRAQTFPNYRTWDMLSDYLYEVDYDYEQRLVNDPDAKREFKTKIVVGLISRWGADAFIPFLMNQGYEEYEMHHGKVNDEVGDFLQSSLEAGVPAMLIGPSSMGKTARVKAYIKKKKMEPGGKEPLLLDISLASKDAVDLMGMPKKQTLVEYVSGSGLNSLGLGSVGKELSDIMSEVSSEESFGLVDSLTIRAPSITYKKAFEKAKAEGREVILFFDECNRCTNPAVMSAMFEAISDYKFANVSFKDYKHKVKIIGACNMAYDAMSSERRGRYDAAGSLDPALAARFSVFWKKRYDEYDVKSWISFMEDQKDVGNIDGILLDYIKEMAEEDIDSVVQLIASVEDRTLIEAVPSTRALFELSKDIKNMRGKPGTDGFASSLYKGKVLFDDYAIQQNSKLRDIIYDSSRSVENRSEEIVRFLKDTILPFRDSWQVALDGTTVDMGEGRVMSGSDLMEVLSDISDILSDAVVKPMDSSKRDECEVWIKTAASILDTVQNLDGAVSDERRTIFTTYVGEDFARNFTPYFDRVFGSVDDSDITIEQLSDDSLISPFFRKISSCIVSKFSGNTEKMVEYMIDLMREFIQVHGSSLPAKNYADFIMGAYSTLPNQDNMVTLLRSGDSSVDAMLAEGEKMGDSWIMQVLRCYPSSITVQDVDDMREALKAKEQAEQANAKKVSRSRIL